MQFHREINHREAFRDHLAAPGQPRQIMTGIGIVPLDRVRPSFTNDMLLWRQHGAVGGPVIGIVHPPGAFYPLVEAAEGGSITTTDDPGDNSPCTTVQRFPEPALVFFDPI
jgi:hypothetical protein